MEEEEAKFDFALLDQVVYNARQIDIRDIGKESLEKAPEVELVNSAEEGNAVVLDIRSPDEEDESPLEIVGWK